MLGNADFDCAGDQGGGDDEFFEGFELGLASDDLAFIGGGLGGFDCVAARAESCVGGGYDSLNAEWFGDADGGAAEGVGADGAVGTLGAVGGLAGGEEEEGGCEGDEYGCFGGKHVGKHRRFERVGCSK